MGTWIWPDCVRVCQNLNNGQNILKVSENASGIISNVFAIHFSYVSFNVQAQSGLECGWFGQNLSAKTSNLKRSEFLFFKKYIGQMYYKNVLILFHEVFVRVSEDSEICRKSSILHGHMDLARLCSSLSKFDQWSEYPQIFQRMLRGLLQMFLLYISLMYLLICTQ